ncbi:MAG: hypothetical protein ACLR3C_19065 [Eggerthella lenta]
MIVSSTKAYLNALNRLLNDSRSIVASARSEPAAAPSSDKRRLPEELGAKRPSIELGA